eukprot:1159044-Amphidinium_carterae.1
MCIRDRLGLYQLCFLSARAQRHSLDGEDMPEPKTMHFLYTFYIYGREDRQSEHAGPLVQLDTCSLTVALLLLRLVGGSC